VIQRLETATARHDFAVICDELLSSTERRQAGGDQCASLLEERAKGVKRPRIRINRIVLGHESAAVHVTTTAAGQAPVADTLRLVREGGRFRIASLGR
jgi:hypothetical protein